MDNERIHLCLEAKDDQGRSVYLIYSAHFKVADFKSKSDSPPLHFIREAVITGGVPSMGCGVFGSKLVLAGGLVKGQNGRDEKCKGVITYDRTTKHVSHEDIAVMRGGKFKPLLFQLDNRLYALDTSLLPNRQSFEVYIPNHKHWHPLPLHRFTYSYHVGQLAESEGFNFFSWFVCGYCLCISLPKDTATYSHHAQYESFHPCHEAPLPFPGMAITYCQHGFQDVVLITFSKQGLVEGHLLHFRRNYLASVFQKPVLIFNTKTYFQHDGVLTGCFAEFGNGTFSLTTFDTDSIYVYIFKVSRRRCKNVDDDLILKLLKISTYSYKYTDFSEAGHTSFSFAGCFAPSQADSWSKERTEAEIYRSHIPLYEEEDDVIPCTKCEYISHADDMNNGMDVGVYTYDY